MDDFILDLNCVDDELPISDDEIEELCDHIYVFTAEDNDTHTGKCIHCDFEASYENEDLITEYKELMV